MEYKRLLDNSAFVFISLVGMFLYLFIHTPYISIMHISIYSIRLSATQLVRALHWNRRAAGSIPARGQIVAFFATAPCQV